MPRRESNFQSNLIKELYELYPGCMILKNDSEYRPGILDLLILFGDRWAALECKTSATAPRRPNQEWYVDEMNRMSYASFIYPGNKEQVLHELQFTLRPRRKARVPQRV